MAKCDFCHLPYKRLVVFKKNEYEIYVELCGNRLRVYDNDYHNSNIESIDINYCPVCGRNLESEVTENDKASM